MIANQLPEEYQLSDEQILILEEEMAAYKENPNEGSSWEEVKKRVFNRIEL